MYTGPWGGGRAAATGGGFASFGVLCRPSFADSKECFFFRRPPPGNPITSIFLLTAGVSSEVICCSDGTNHLRSEGFGSATCFPFALNWRCRLDSPYGNVMGYVSMDTCKRESAGAQKLTTAHGPTISASSVKTLDASADYFPTALIGTLYSR
jgi:hypothetical protein